VGLLRADDERRADSRRRPHAVARVSVGSRPSGRTDATLTVRDSGHPRSTSRCLGGVDLTRCRSAKGQCALAPCRHNGASRATVSRGADAPAGRGHPFEVRSLPTSRTIGARSHFAVGVTHGCRGARRAFR
jgi:hypothetical protein